MHFNKQTRLAFRVIGNLLDKHGTTDAYARKAKCYSVPLAPNNPNAGCWCLEGAVDVVGTRVFPGCNLTSLANSIGEWLDLKEDVSYPSWDGRHPKYLEPCRYDLIRAWDYCGDEGRKEIVEKLKNA